MNDHYTGALLEDINHKLDAILEGEISLRTLSQKVDDVDKRLINVEDKVIVIKKVVTEHSRILQGYSKRFKF